MIVEFIRKHNELSEFKFNSVNGEPNINDLFVSQVFVLIFNYLKMIFFYKYKILRTADFLKIQLRILYFENIELVKSIIDFIKSPSCDLLNSITFKNNSMNEKDSFLIAKLIERNLINNNFELYEINFIKNRIDEKGLNVFKNIIKSFDHLTHISLADNNITNFSNLVEELPNCKNIMSLNFSNNKMNKNTSISFLKILQKLENLESLFLIDCDFSESQSSEIIMICLQNCPNIKEIYFSNDINEIICSRDRSEKTFKQLSLNDFSEISIKEKPSKRINFAIDVEDSKSINLSYDDGLEEIKSSLPKSKSNSSNFADNEIDNDYETDDDDADYKNEEFLKKTESLMLSRKHSVEHWINVGNFDDRLTEAHVTNYFRVNYFFQFLNSFTFLYF